MLQPANRIFAIQKIFSQPQERGEARFGLFTDRSDFSSAILNLLKFTICELYENILLTCCS